MPRLPIPSDTDEFSNETRAAVRHIRETRKSMPPPSSYLAYAGRAGSLLSDLVDHLRYRTSLTGAETELAICTAARAANADYIWDAHVRLGLQAGTREIALHAVDTHGPLDDLTEDEEADHSLRSRVIASAAGRRRNVSRGAGALRRERLARADGHHECIHDER